MNFNPLALIILLSFPSVNGFASLDCKDIFSLHPALSYNWQTSTEDIEIRLLKALEATPHTGPSDTLTHYFLLLDLLQELQQPFAVSASAQERLQDLFSEKYNIPYDNHHLQIFIQNRMHYLASRKAWDYKQQLVNHLAQTPLKGRMAQYAHALIDSYFTLSQMNDFDANRDYIRGITQQQPWQNFPWATAFELINAWEDRPTKDHSSALFNKWYDSLESKPIMKFNDLQRLRQAIINAEHKPALVLCCKSSFACLQCPHNRRWLKDRTK